jgi:hypothetical protein
MNLLTALRRRIENKVVPEVAKLVGHQELVAVGSGMGRHLRNFLVKEIVGGPQLFVSFNTYAKGDRRNNGASAARQFAFTLWFRDNTEAVDPDRAFDVLMAIIATLDGDQFDVLADDNSTILECPKLDVPNGTAVLFDQESDAFSIVVHLYV